MGDETLAQEEKRVTKQRRKIGNGKDYEEDKQVKKTFLKCKRSFLNLSPSCIHRHFIIFYDDDEDVLSLSQMCPLMERKTH
ncbi:hypothetical protein CEXT_586961 [Caerostris extrusa]|uniref:Uncharacterized protein n=1 Tax=Caerostris extrusa TaxID=172846 RepID=A0AAV4RKE4_CAEEX|nr:hypothetical protein CEXT_586961 [Caerostris extrusa]